MFSLKIKKILETETLKKINFDKNFKDNKLDSLDLMTIFNTIENEYKIKLKSTKLDKVTNFKELYKLLNKN